VVLLALAVLGGAPAAPAAAAQRFAAPDGTGDCTSAPCDIATAINNAASGDEVILDSGRYGSDLAPLTTALQSTQTNLNVHGTDGEPRPRIFTNAQYGLDLGGAGGTARHLEIQQSASNVVHQHALVLQDGQATDVVVRNATGGGRACTLLGSSVLTNSVCEATAQDGRGVFPYRDGTNPAANSSIIRNATVVASGSGGYGITAFGGPAPADTENLTVTNTIIIVPSGSLAIGAFPGSGGDASITIDHSNFGFQNDLVHIHKGEGNQQLTKAPTFVDPGDYHEAASSITIDAGATTALNGPTDFDGDLRSLGLGGTDIGADGGDRRSGRDDHDHRGHQRHRQPEHDRDDVPLRVRPDGGLRNVDTGPQRRLRHDARPGVRAALGPRPRHDVPLPARRRQHRRHDDRRRSDLHDDERDRPGRRRWWWRRGTDHR
jgi:hypothetical protein